MNIAVMGYGTVGSGVAEVFYNSRKLLEKRTGISLDIKYILDLRTFPESPYADKIVHDFNQILNDETIRIVVEAMGGMEPAFSFTKACLERGKSVVTSNKELVAKRGWELLETAKAHDCNYLFEASVGGGVPVLRPLHNCLAANHIQEIAGIFNGTTNFILTKMIREQMSFSDALALAQKNGFAEQNPSADVDGDDACRKLCIMADMAYGAQFHPDSVPTEGISKITMEDVAYAANWGGAVKLVGQAKQDALGEPVYLRVSPAFVRADSQLGACSGVYNAILVRGDAVEDVVFYGQGAGKRPTASAVMADILDCLLMGHNDPSMCWSGEAGTMADTKDNVCAFYFRCENAAKADVEQVFGKVRFLQRPLCPEGELAFVTEPLPEKEQDTCQAALEGRGASVLGRIRVLGHI